MRALNTIFHNQMLGSKINLVCDHCRRHYFPPIATIKEAHPYSCTLCSRTQKRNRYTFIDHTQKFSSFYGFNSYYFIRMVAEDRYDFKCRSIHAYHIDVDNPDVPLNKLDAIPFSAVAVSKIQSDLINIATVNDEYKTFLKEWSNKI